MTVPEQIGNYKLEREIGRGASSEVWLARHVHLQEHLVAIKVLMSQDREAIRRFQREAALAARLRHPNIVQLYDYGHQPPFFYTLIEYVPGGSLRQLLDRKSRLPLAEALAIFRQVATALDYAHSLGVVHRDVSPGNILVEASSGRTVLTDFGIARDPGQPITIASSIMGTPGYLSPEHAQSATAVTHLSDLFGLGVVLYQMLSGVLPWDETPGMPDGPAFSPPIPLLQRGVEGLPSDVDRVLRTMLALDPARRFPSARAAVEELERIFNRHTMPTQVLLAGKGAPPPAEAVQFQSGGVEANAVEAVLGPDLVRAPIDRAHRRADELRNPANVAALLDTWSAQSRLRLRRKFLGRLARLHKVTSHNVYFYRLRLLYERRAPAEDDEEPDRKAQPFPLSPEVDRWEVEIPPLKGFADEPGDRVVIPGSTRVVSCKPCAGRGMTVCPRCNGKQRIYVARPVAAPAGAGAAPTSAASLSSPAAPGRPAASPAGAKPATTVAEPPPRLEQVLIPCPECSGRGGVTCQRCSGVGRLIQRKTFRWQRSTELLQAQDDLPEVDEDWLAHTCQSEVIYNERQPGGARPEWSLVPGVAALIQQVQSRLDGDTRIILSELSVSFIPITEIVFDLGKPGDGGLYKLAIYGFENRIPTDWRFLDWERVLFICAVAFLAVVVLVMLGFLLLV